MPRARSPKGRMTHARSAHHRWSAAELEALIEEATVDAYGESEQRTGLFTMIEEHLALPFETELLGVKVQVERVDLTVEDEIVAVCRRSRDRLAIPLAYIPMPDRPPAGAEWIAAYRHWSRRWAGAE